MDFKVGDMVVCIINEGQESHLELNKVYKIFHLKGGKICISDIKFWFFKSRFILITSTLEKAIYGLVEKPFDTNE